MARYTTRNTRNNAGTRSGRVAWLARWVRAAWHLWPLRAAWVLQYEDAEHRGRA